MPIEIIRNDITRMRVDAIVNAANQTLLGGGGVDGAIHRAAGPLLLEECRTLGGCRTGDAKITGGYALPCRYVIHTVGPVWRGGLLGEKHQLASCYRKSLALAQEHGCQSVAFPLISAGVYGYPREKAMRVAIDVIREFLEHSDMTVYIVVFDRVSCLTGEKLFAGVKRYIDDRYVSEYEILRSRRLYEEEMETGYVMEYAQPCQTAPAEPGESAPWGWENAAPKAAAPCGLAAALRQIDESFSQMVMRKIDEKGIKDSVCYKRANMDRKHFSKIRSDVHYRPRKATAAAMAIALELPVDEAKELLMKAGFALSRSSKFDIIIEYCLINGIYDIHTVNQLLFEFDQETLGA